MNRKTVFVFALIASFAAIILVSVFGLAPEDNIKNIVKVQSITMAFPSEESYDDQGNTITVTRLSTDPKAVKLSLAKKADTVTFVLRWVVLPLKATETSARISASDASNVVIGTVTSVIEPDVAQVFSTTLTINTTITSLTMTVTNYDNTAATDSLKILISLPGGSIDVPDL